MEIVEGRAKEKDGRKERRETNVPIYSDFSLWLKSRGFLEKIKEVIYTFPNFESLY